MERVADDCPRIPSAAFADDGGGGRVIIAAAEDDLIHPHDLTETEGVAQEHGTISLPSFRGTDAVADMSAFPSKEIAESRSDIHHSENIGHQIDYKNSYDIIQGKEESARR